MFCVAARFSGVRPAHCPAHCRLGRRGGAAGAGHVTGGQASTSMVDQEVTNENGNFVFSFAGIDDAIDVCLACLNCMPTEQGVGAGQRQLQDSSLQTRPWSRQPRLASLSSHSHPHTALLNTWPGPQSASLTEQEQPHSVCSCQYKDVRQFEFEFEHFLKLFLKISFKII